MCSPDSVTSSGAAIAAVEAGLAWLSAADATGLTADEQAGCLRALERAESRLTAARAGILAAFAAARGYEADGQGGPRSWLAWQTRITPGAAAGATGWMRRLAAHPAISAALAAAAISASWARQVCDWTDQLPAEHRTDADQILLAAASGGADIRDLGALAEEIFRRTAQPDTDDDGDGFAGRFLQLDRHYRGAGKLDADLTPPCAAALQAVLDALGRKAGPEDTRTQRQRDHDALEEACRRLIAAGDLPDRAGQPTQIQLHLSLDQLRGMDGAADAEQAWAAAAQGHGEPGWLTSRQAAEAYACDAQITPIVAGHVDPAALASMTASYLAQPGSPDVTRLAGLPPRTLRRLQDTLLRHAADVLSGPAGLAAFLRTGLLATEFPPALSLPLDVGAATQTVPPHLRRAVISRDRHCAFPGCQQRPAACQVHHIRPRSEGGLTCLANLILLCPFHHLTAILRWGWRITLAPDGTTAVTSPDGRRAFRSHGPPQATVA